MDKNTILDYVTETPWNTNRAVLSSMLDSIEGGVEMITLFDDDISVTNYSPGSQYGPAYGNGSDVFSNSAAENGIVKVTYEDKSSFGIYTKSSDNAGFNLSVSINYMDSLFSGFKLGSYDAPNSFYFSIYGAGDQEVEFETYCQEPHHLKVEWFIV